VSFLFICYLLVKPNNMFLFSPLNKSTWFQNSVIYLSSLPPDRGITFKIETYYPKPISSTSKIKCGCGIVLHILLSSEYIYSIKGHGSQTLGILLWQFIPQYVICSGIRFMFTIDSVRSVFHSFRKCFMRREFMLRYVNF